VVVGRQLAVPGKARVLAQEIRPGAVHGADRSPQSDGMAEAFVKALKRDYGLAPA